MWRCFTAFYCTLTAFALISTALASATIDLDRKAPFSGLDDAIFHSPYHPMEYSPGVTGDAVDFDGYSTWATGQLKKPIKAPATISLFAAIRSYPTTRAGLITIEGEQRLAITINRWGHLAVELATPGRAYQTKTHSALARDRWVHIAIKLGTGDRQPGLSIFVDGQETATLAHALPDDIELGGQFVLGRDLTAGVVHQAYPQGVFNGALDGVRIEPLSLNRLKLEQRAAAAQNKAPRLAIPKSRFADDPHRPVYHPMPPAGWTNEPHALTRVGDSYHMFYQANPSGPWWAHMQWGHLVSRDMATWHPRRTAIFPTPGFDRAGIWVGDVVKKDGRHHAVYTGVNGQWAGVGLASSADDELRRFTKSTDNPLLIETPRGYQDMRDPFIVRRENDWLMLIGSGTKDRTTPTILTFSSTNLERWTFEGPLEIGTVERDGEYWELPKLLDFGDKWALVVTTVKPGTPARTQYWLGAWDGQRFFPDHPTPQLLDVFTTHLAHTFAPIEPGRMVALGVAPEEYRTANERLEAGWIHGFGLARNMSLCPDRARLCQTVLPAVNGLFASASAIEPAALDGSPLRLDPGGEDGSVARVRLTIDPGDAREIVLSVRATSDGSEKSQIRMFPESGRLALDFSRSSETPTARSDVLWGAWNCRAGEPVTMTLFIDRSFVDVFLDSGDAFGFRTFPTSGNATHIFLEARNGRGRLLAGDFAPFDAEGQR